MAVKAGKAEKGEETKPVKWKGFLFDPAKQYGASGWMTSALENRRHPPTAEMGKDLVMNNAEESVPPRFRKEVEVCGKWEKIDGTQLYLAAWLFPGIPRAGTRTAAGMVRDMAVELRMVGK